MHRGLLPKRLGLAALVLVLVSSCSEAHETPQPQPKAKEAKPSDPLAAQIWETALARMPEYDPVDTFLAGEIAPGTPHDFAVVLQNGRCTRVLGVAEGTVTDLDLAVFDPNGSLVRQETAVGPKAEVGFDHPVCPPATAVYRIQVGARSGQGKFAVRAYQSPW